MSANVRCAGLPIVTRMREMPDEYDQMPPCGWKGERFTRGAAVSSGDGSAEHPYKFDFLATLANDRQAMTAKPCPRCGGQVVLVPVGETNG